MAQNECKGGSSGAAPQGPVADAESQSDSPVAANSAASNAIGSATSIAGGNANETARSSADAAALTVGGSKNVSPAPPASKSQLAGKTKAGIAALAVVSALLIGVGAFALAGGQSAKNDPIGVSTTPEAASVAKAESSAALNGEPTEGGERHDGEAASQDAPDEQATPEDKVVSEQAGADARRTDDVSSSASAASGGSGSGSSPSSSAPAGGSNSQPPTSDTAQQPAANTISVSVSVDSSAVGGSVSASGSFSFEAGATPYDALCALGLSVNARSTGYGTYVAAIGGLAEKEHGGQSGWMYSVNGTTPMTACSNYVLSDGDVVVWYYVTG